MRNTARILRFVSALTLLLTVGAVDARSEPTPDGIGIYLDQAGTLYCSNSPAPYSSVQLYLVVTNLSEPSGLAYWETGIFSDPDPLLLPPVVTVPGCDVGCALPFLRVGLAAPLPRAPTIVLASLSLLYTGGSIRLLLGACEPTVFPSNPGPGYGAGDDPTRLIRLQAGTDLYVDPQHPDRRTVFFLGVPGVPCGEGWDANEATTWGHIKQMYGRR